MSVALKMGWSPRRARPGHAVPALPRPTPSCPGHAIALACGRDSMQSHENVLPVAQCLQAAAVALQILPLPLATQRTSPRAVEGYPAVCLSVWKSGKLKTGSWQGINKHNWISDGQQSCDIYRAAIG